MRNSKKIKITAVSYLNTKPLLYGIFKSGIADQIDLQLNIPSECARKLKAGEVDMGLVPVAIIPELNQPTIISDFCIGTVGAVQTVAIFSEVPIEEVEQLYLDYHSRTSVELAKVLLRDYWKLSPTLLRSKPGYETAIKGKTAGLIIGDRAMDLIDKYPYFYDLGEIWMKYTGLPFVFAAWVSSKPIDPDFIKAFNKALETGLKQIPQLIYLIPPPYPNYDLNAYFTHYISYNLDQEKKKALSLFLDLMTMDSPKEISKDLVFI